MWPPFSECHRFSCETKSCEYLIQKRRLRGILTVQNLISRSNSICSCISLMLKYVYFTSFSFYNFMLPCMFSTIICMIKEWQIIDFPNKSFYSAVYSHLWLESDQSNVEYVRRSTSVLCKDCGTWWGRIKYFCSKHPETFSNVMLHI